MYQRGGEWRGSRVQVRSRRRYGTVGFTLKSEQVEVEEPNEVIRHNRMVFHGWCAGEGTKEKQRKATIADTDERGLHWTEGMQSADVNSGRPRVASFVSWDLADVDIYMVS